MRSISLLLIAVCTQVYAQYYSIGITAEPSFQMPVLLQSDHPSFDSLNEIIGKDLGVFASIEFGIQLDRVNSLHFKPSFYKAGFELSRYDLQLFDLIHPALGEVKDLAQASSKNVFYHHRFMYIGLEAEYKMQLGSNQTNLPLKFGAFGGLGIHYLIKQDLMIITEGFAVDQSFKHRIEDSIFFDASKIIATAFFGGELAYDVHTNFQVFARAKFRSSLMASTSNEPRVFIWSTGLEAGFRRYL